MKAVVFEQYGTPEVLKLKNVEKPVPKDNEILVKNHATSVTIGDVIIRRGKHPDSKFQSIMLRVILGFRKPKSKKRILGMELAGVIEAAGKNVTKFKEGDQIFASTGFNFGAYAEYVCLSEDGVIAPKPSNLTIEESAAGFASGAITALVTLRKANIQEDQKVLIYGASGSVGTFAVQIAKYYGAKVTGICSTKNLDLVKSLGADTVLDYTKEDFTSKEETYDVIFDAVAKLIPSKAKKVLNQKGVYLSVIKDSPARIFAEDLLQIKEIIEQGKLKAQIDKTYSLDDIVEAHKYVEKGHKKGNVLVTIG